MAIRRGIGETGLVCVWLLSAIAVVAQTPAADDEAWVGRIRRDHPRMFFTRETWPDIVARTKGSPAASAALKNLIRAADSYPTNPVCLHTERVFTPPSQPIVNTRDWGGEAAKCALAWRFTGERKYLEKAKTMLRVSAAAYREAYANGREVHWYSTNRILAFSAYDWIYEGLTDDERRSIIVPLVEHADETNDFKRRIIRRNGGGWQTGFYGVQSLWWYSGLAAHGDGFCDALARKHLVKGRERFVKLLEYRADIAGDDGGLSSGVPDYSMGAYPWSHFNFLHTWLSATGENLAFKYPSLALFPNWIWWNRIETANPTRPHAFGFGDDQHQSLWLSCRSLYEHMTQYAHFFRDADPDAARLAATLCALAPNRDLARTWPMYPFLFAASDVKPFTAEEVAARRLGARHFSALGQFFLRSGRQPDSTYCLYTAGSKTTMHKHWDENNFVIFRHGPLALDSGSRGKETDTNLRYYYAQTVAHNCVLVHKPGEEMPYHWGLGSDEPEAKVNHGGQFEGAGDVLAFETTPAYTYIASDAARVYKGKCKVAIRQFVHVQPNVFVVYDRVDATSPDYRTEWLLHMQNEPLVEGLRTRADCDGGRLFCETLLPADGRIAKVGGPGREFWASGKNWELDPKFVAQAAKTAKVEGIGPYFASWRIEVTPRENTGEHRFLHILTAAETSEAVGVHAVRLNSGECDGVRLELPGKGTVEVHFRRAGTVGGIIVQNGQTRTLTEKVQPQSGIVGL